MSLKPLKKSDLRKSWINPRRDKVIKMPPEFHLIVTEGTDTEPLYFQRIREIINLNYKGKIEIEIHDEGDNTLSLFEKAHRRALASANVFKHVWIVYDTDDFPAKHIDETARLCKVISSEDTRYHAVWSNQCIELWFLLHFSFMQSDIHRNEYFSKLTDCLTKISRGNYLKSRTDMFDVLLPFIDTAVENAKKLDRLNAKKLPSQSAPGTKVFELVEKLKTYLIV